MYRYQICQTCNKNEIEETAQKLAQEDAPDHYMHYPHDYTFDNMQDEYIVIATWRKYKNFPKTLMHVKWRSGSGEEGYVHTGKEELPV